MTHNFFSFDLTKCAESTLVPGYEGRGRWLATYVGASRTRLTLRIETAQQIKFAETGMRHASFSSTPAAARWMRGSCEKLNSSTSEVLPRSLVTLLATMQTTFTMLLRN